MNFQKRCFCETPCSVQPLLLHPSKISTCPTCRWRCSRPEPSSTWPPPLYLRCSRQSTLFHESSLHSRFFDNIAIFHISTFWPFPNWKPPSEALKKFSQTSRAAQLSYLGTSIKNYLRTSWGQLGDNLWTTWRLLTSRAAQLDAACILELPPCKHVVALLPRLHRNLTSPTDDDAQDEGGPPAAAHPRQETLLTAPLHVPLLHLRRPLLHQRLHQLSERVAQTFCRHL